MKNINDICFVIQARLSSQRVKKKMIREFHDTNLFEISIQKALSLDIPKKNIYVSIYEKELIDIANKYKINIFIRSDKSALWDNKKDGDLGVMYEWWNKLPFKYCILLNPCLPFLKVDTINRFIDKYVNIESEGLFGVIEKKNYFWNSRGKLITQWPEGETCMNTKLVEKTNEAAHCLYAGRIDTIGNNIWMGDFSIEGSIELFSIHDSECLDVDYEWEFRLCEALYKETKLRIVIHTNKYNILSALVSKYSLKKYHPYLDVDIVTVEEHFPKFLENDSKTFIRKSRDYDCFWYKDYSQSFFPIRFLIPELYNYSGHLLIIDPDVFLVKKMDNIEQYFNGKKLCACMNINNLPASSVMLLNASKFKHWNYNKLCDDLFNDKKDFDDYMYLKDELKEDNISILPDYYNEYDKINDKTILLHTTKTHTQPWKTGLSYKEHELHNIPKSDESKDLIFKQHESKEVEDFFFKLAKEAYNNNYINDDLIKDSIKNKYIREDFYKKL